MTGRVCGNNVDLYPDLSGYRKGEEEGARGRKRKMKTDGWMDGWIGWKGKTEKEKGAKEEKRNGGG